MEAGAIVEFSTSSEHRLGVVTGEVGKQKLVVVALGGAQMRPARADVTFETGKKADPTSAAMIQRSLEALDAQIEELRLGLELELLWEMVLELGEEMDEGDMADLALGSTEAAAKLAVLRALRADGVFFKQRKRGFEPRERAQVEQLREQLEIQRRREQERVDFIGTVAALMSIPADSRAQAVEAKLAADTTFRQHFDVLREFAAMGDDSPRRDRALEFLDILGDDIPLRGRGQGRAFSLMVNLGIWTKHENLWLRRYHISEAFKPELLAEAEALAAKPFEAEPWRKDLSHLHSFTIDDESSRDLDDALSIEPLEHGGYRVGIHIADPSAVVPSGSALELEARARGTSLYLPTGNTPMFPPILSEGALSLVAGSPRATLSTMVELDAAFELLNVEVIPATLTVTHRLSYDQVDAILAGAQDHPSAQALGLLDQVARAFAARRAEAGAANFSFPEAKLYVEDERSDEPTVSCEMLETGSPSRALVSEMMILGSSSMGEFCSRHQIPVIYRTQDPPESPLLDEETLKLPEGLVRDSAMVRKMRPASITTHPGRHFGLGVPVYVQATSPIRRFGDYLCQQQVKAHLAGEPLPYTEDELLRVAATVETTAREARVIERESVRYWTLYFFERHLHESFDAVVVDYRDDGKAFVFVTALGWRDKVDLRERVPLGEVVAVKAIKAGARQDMLKLVQVRERRADDPADQDEVDEQDEVEAGAPEDEGAQESSPPA